VTKQRPPSANGDVIMQKNCGTEQLALPAGHDRHLALAGRALGAAYLDEGAVRRDVLAYGAVGRCSSADVATVNATRAAASYFVNLQTWFPFSS
jgi:hypothetical protein